MFTHHPVGKVGLFNMSIKGREKKLHGHLTDAPTLTEKSTGGIESPTKQRRRPEKDAGSSQASKQARKQTNKQADHQYPAKQGKMSSSDAARGRQRYKRQVKCTR